MRKSTLNSETMLGRAFITFQMGNKIYNFCDIATDIIPCEGTLASTGERIKTTETIRLFIVKEIGKLDYKVFDSRIYGEKQIIVL